MDNDDKVDEKWESLVNLINHKINFFVRASKSIICL